MASQGLTETETSTDFEDRLRSLEGANLLVTGPPLVGKSPFALGQLAGADDALLVTTTRSAERQLEGTGLDVGSLSIVDCTPTDASGPRVMNVNTPADLTGISMPISRFLDGAARPRLAVDSISSILMYAEKAPVFRFLSVLTGHVRQSDGLGLYTLDEGCHDHETVATIEQLFDGRIELREGEDGPEIRAVGIDELPDDWRPI